jgi:peptidylprolyl isomerase/FKBP-type peptidyl-prolyl cis-trans isomerase FklB
MTQAADPILLENLAKARAFLAENAKKPGVVKLPSGAQYKILTSGEKDASCPTMEDRVRVIYEGTLPDGTKFDSSEGSAVSFPLTALIPGWKHVVPMMRIGDEWMIYLPPNLGYGEKGALGIIPPNGALVFKMKLVGIQ